MPIIDTKTLDKLIKQAEENGTGSASITIDLMTKQQIPAEQLAEKPKVRYFLVQGDNKTEHASLDELVAAIPKVDGFSKTFKNPETA